MDDKKPINKFINKGKNFNPYTIPFFNIEGVEQFANLIAEEIEKNKVMDKKALIRGRIIWYNLN